MIPKATSIPTRWMLIPLFVIGLPLAGGSAAAPDNRPGLNPRPSPPALTAPKQEQTTMQNSTPQTRIEMSQPVTVADLKTGGDQMTFSDKPEFVILPRLGAVPAVECAVYPPRPSATGAGAGLVLHLYGRGGSCRDYNMTNSSYAMVRRLLWERGYWLVIPELGTDHWMNDPAGKRLDTVIESMIRDRGVDPARVHILGVSMGGGSGLGYALRRPGRIRSVCAICPMTDFTQWVQEVPRYLPGIALAHGVPPSAAESVLRNISPLRQVAGFADIPVFLVHGDSDSVVPVHHSRDFAAALQSQGSRVTYHESRGLGHDDAIVEPFQREIADFLTAD